MNRRYLTTTSLLASVVLFGCAPLPTGQATSVPVASYDAATKVSELARHALDSGLFPFDVYGNEYAGVAGWFGGGAPEVRVVDLTSGETVWSSGQGWPKHEVAFTQRYVAWLEKRGEAVAGVDTVFLYDIYVYDRRTGQRRQVTAELAPRMQLTLDGDWLVWADKRNELQAHYTEYDLYAYDLAAGREVPLAVATGAQVQPSIDGGRVVWSDNRNSPERGSTLAGCSNCRPNRYDIYLHDFSTGETRALVEDQALKTNPSIAADRVVWEAYSDVPVPGADYAVTQADIYLLDLGTGLAQRLTETLESESQPIVSGDQVVWTVRQACDVTSGPVGGQATPVPPRTGVFAINLTSGLLSQITGYVEPRALFHAGRAVITEGCMTGYETYYVLVD